MITRKTTTGRLPSGAFMLNGRVYVRDDSHEGRAAFSVDDGRVVEVPSGEATTVKMER